MRPGLIQPEAGSHEVVWWDPSKLKLGEELNQTLWQDEVLAQTLKEDGGVSLAAYRAWRRSGARSARWREAGSRGVPGEPGAEDPPASPRGVSCDVDASGGFGERFGTLVHAVLRDVLLDSSREAVRKTTELNARVLGAPADEAGAAASAVENALAHPVFERARAASLAVALPSRVSGDAAARGREDAGRRGRSRVRRRRRMDRGGFQDRRGL